MAPGSARTAHTTQTGTNPLTQLGKNINEKQSNKTKSLSTEQPNNHAAIKKGIRQSASENKVEKLMTSLV